MSKLPDDNTVVDDNKRLVKEWLGVFRKLVPAMSFSQAFVDKLIELSPADIAVLQQLILAASVPVPDTPVVPPYTVNVQTFTQDGTWVNPGFGSIARIRCRSGGGSGAARGLATAGVGGGGGGSCVEVWMLISELPESVTVEIGLGGAAVSGTNNGNAGGDTTFGAFVLAPGGGGGTQSAGTGLGGFGAGLTPGSTGIEAVISGAAKTNATSASGGGAGGRGVDTTSAIAGGDAFNGGAGGGGAEFNTNSLGGVSTNGGDGGAGNGDGNGGDGQFPSGGGGAAVLGTSGRGGDGDCEVTVF